jgi:hypothetical protein
MTRGTPFELGNKFGRGRPPGSRNKLIRPEQRLLQEHALQLMRRGLIEALNKDSMDPKFLLFFLKCLCLEKPQAQKLRLKPLKTAEDIQNANGEVIRAVAIRKITAADGQALTAMLEGQLRMLQDKEHELRLQNAEGQIKEGGSTLRIVA